MKYLSFDSDEFKELLNLKRGSLIIYGMLFIILLLIVGFVSKSLLPQNAIITPEAIIFAFSIAYLAFLTVSNKNYFSDIIKKEKKVYRGVLAIKSVTRNSNKFTFNIDGNIFIVDQSIFDSFLEGELLEVHISARTKHLFKVQKVA